MTPESSARDDIFFPMFLSAYIRNPSASLHIWMGFTHQHRALNKVDIVFLSDVVVDG